MTRRDSGPVTVTGRGLWSATFYGGINSGNRYPLYDLYFFSDIFYP